MVGGCELAVTGKGCRSLADLHYFQVAKKKKLSIHGFQMIHPVYPKFGVCVYLRRKC